MSFSGNQSTRLGLSGITRGLYGGFAGKAEAAEPVNDFCRSIEIYKAAYRSDYPIGYEDVRKAGFRFIFGPEEL